MQHQPIAEELSRLVADLSNMSAALEGAVRTAQDLPERYTALRDSVQELVMVSLDALGDALETAKMSCGVVGDLPDEAARLELPDDRELRIAMFDAGAHERPVSATEIARVLWHGEHGHGEVVRLGQMLGMLESVGLVDRHPSNSRAARWSLPS